MAVRSLVLVGEVDACFLSSCSVEEGELEEEDSAGIFRRKPLPQRP